jgi:coatomer protein complex subunit gamma
MYSISQGNRIGEDEQNDLFFAFMKLFQSTNSRLRRLVYVLLKDLSEGSSSVFMVTNCLSKDMQSKNDCYRGNAIRSARILDAGTVSQIDRYLKAAVVDKSSFVSSAALVCGAALLKANPEMIRRWVNEVGEALSSKHPMVQYHALHLMYELKKQDRLALQKLICGFASGQTGGPVGTRSPQVECLLIGYATGMVLADSEPQIARVLLSYLDSCLRNKSEIVTFEAARSLCYLAQVETEQSGSRKLNSTVAVAMGLDFTHALTILQIALGSSTPVNRLAALRTLNALSKSRPLVVSKCNVDIEPLLSDENRNIATLALTVLLKTAQESSVDKLVKQIGSFMNDLTDIYKLDVVSAVRSLCDAYPAKHKTMLNFLASALRDEGSHGVKQAVSDAIISIVNAIPESLELGLTHLCEFIEDCEFPNLCSGILAFMTEHVPATSNPAKYVRFIYNRLILENATVRVAAVESLTRIALKCPELKSDITVLLETATGDSDDEVRDRLSWYLNVLSDSGSTYAGSEIDETPSFSVDALYDALEQHMLDPNTVAKPFDINNVPDHETYTAELRAREVAAAAAAHVAAAKEAALNVGPSSAPSGLTEAVLEGPRPEFSASVGAIIDVQSLGKLQHVCKPQMLTEPEAEYTVQVVKHVFARHTVFEFFVSNTVDGISLSNVQIKLGNVDSSSWAEIGSVPISSVAFGEGKSAFTVLQRLKATPVGAFSASLHFVQHEDGDPSGFPDDFPIDHVRVQVSDYIYPRPLPAGQFQRAWDSLGNYEKVQKYALNYRTLEATVAGLMNSLNMAPCEATDKLEPGVQKPTFLLAGNYIGGVPLLAQAILYIHPQRGCMIQVTSRGGTEEAADAAHKALE